MKYLYPILVSVLISVSCMAGFYYYVPIDSILRVENSSNGVLGTSITTIQGSDTLKNSRTTINDNFSALNNGKIENSTTSLPLITTLSGLTTANNLVSIGTIATGTWRGSVIAVPYGGTGASTFNPYQILIGNGTGTLSQIASGTAGQQLTFSSTSSPYWATAGVNQSADYSWTGAHTFGTATTTFNNYVNFTGTSTGAGFSHIQVITSATSTWSVPRGINKIKVRVVGPGGNGGAMGNNGGGGGGGAGGYSEKIIDVSATSSIYVIVGQGGSGTTTSFSSYLSATAGSVGGTGATYASGGAGGTGSGGDINVTGGAGIALFSVSGQCLSGAGGSSVLGGGGLGINAACTASTGGNAGGAYGGGGGGSGGTGAAGTGATGVVIIEY